MSETSRLGSNSVRSTSRTRGSAARRRAAAKNIVAPACPPGRAPGAPGHLGAVDHVDVEIDHDRSLLGEAVERLVEHRLDAAARGNRRW